ncbi:hypothetical protein OG604_37245 [Streptomyces sp. NBC_01231]|nr:hypothetical protein OG604_37245 [Streptomyces sp. NBC_01231]
MPLASAAGVVLGAIIAAVVSFLTARYNQERQRILFETTISHEERRFFNERFSTASSQLGNEQAAVRLAGVHAMAGLADDWEEQRQTCIEVLCAYLRIPYAPKPDTDTPLFERLEWQQNREVRRTIVRVIRGRLTEEASISWQGHSFDFSGGLFDGVDLSGISVFSGTQLTFRGATFYSGALDCRRMRLDGGGVSFAGCRIGNGTKTAFSHSQFIDGVLDFSRMECHSRLDFEGVKLSQCVIDFRNARFETCEVTFVEAELLGGEIDFSHSKVPNARFRFHRVKLAGAALSFDGVSFSYVELQFHRMEFLSGLITFRCAQLDDGCAVFSGGFIGGRIDFGYAEFVGADVLFMGDSCVGTEVDMHTSFMKGGEFTRERVKPGVRSYGQEEFQGRPPRFQFEGPTTGILLPEGFNKAP